MTKENVLVLIDCQCDFIDDPKNPGSLAVKGAYEDMQRIAQFIKEKNPSDIILTLDTHNKMDIALSSWWLDAQGCNVKPFTPISLDDVVSGKYRSTIDSLQTYSEYYVSQLEVQGNKSLFIWPDHCIKGTLGHEVHPIIVQAVKDWELMNNKKAQYVEKGQNPYTENFSVFKAEVELVKYPETLLNVDLINKIDQFNTKYFAGEAKSHCVADSTIDFLKNINNPSSVVILENCMSDVPGFNSDKFMEFVKEKGCVIENVIESKKLRM